MNEEQFLKIRDSFWDHLVVYGGQEYAQSIFKELDIDIPKDIIITPTIDLNKCSKCDEPACWWTYEDNIPFCVEHSGCGRYPGQCAQCRKMDAGCLDINGICDKCKYEVFTKSIICE